MIKEYIEPMPENVQEQRYREVVYMDAIDMTGKTVKVINEGASRIVTEAQIDSELVSVQEKLAELQTKKDEITALKSE